MRYAGRIRTAVIIVAFGLLELLCRSGVIGAEFITSSRGIGYEIAYAYNNFDNLVMYPLIFLILSIVTVINISLYAWEKKLLARRSSAS